MIPPPCASTCTQVVHCVIAQLCGGCRAVPAVHHAVGAAAPSCEPAPCVRQCRMAQCRARTVCPGAKAPRVRTMRSSAPVPPAQLPTSCSGPNCPVSSHSGLCVPASVQVWATLVGGLPGITTLLLSLLTGAVSVPLHILIRCLTPRARCRLGCEPHYHAKRVET